MSVPTSDFDSGWKETVEVFLPSLVDLFLPTIGPEISIFASRGLAVCSSTTPAS